MTSLAFLPLPHQTILMKNKPTLCLYHNDADGRASAAIVRRALGSEIVLHEINYGNPIPWDKIEAAEQVVIVDFSLPAADMQHIVDTKSLIWIDHHQSALDELGTISMEWDGARDTSEAACVLTWRYFYPSDEVPQAIVLVGDRDIWRWAEKDTGAFSEGLFQQYNQPENDKLWEPLLNNDKQAVQRIIDQGAVLLDARLRSIRGEVNNYGYPARFEGYRTLVINRSGNGDLGARIRELGYQIAYCYVDNVQNGELKTFVSLYSDEIDVSKIARKFGGGGHPGASGFNFKRGATPFPPEAKAYIVDEG